MARAMRNAFLPSLAFWALLINAAFGQSVQQSGAVTPNTAAIWSGTGIIKGGVTAADSPLTTFGVTREAVDAFCVSSARLTAVGRNQLCFQASTTGPAKISLQNYGTAAAQNLEFVINGTTVTIPTGSGSLLRGQAPFIATDVPCFVDATGLLQDCGLKLSAGSVLSGVWTATPIDLLYGGTGATSAAGARTNLGLGTLAVQNANTVAITGGAITGMPSPSASSDVTTKAYVDGLANGLRIIASSNYATAAVLPNTPTYSNGTSGVGATLTAGGNAAIVVDGLSPTINQVVLVKNQASASQNGIYTVTTVGSVSVPWVLTRATYFDAAAEMLSGSYSFISSGNTNGGTAWVLLATVTTVGTDPASFGLFSQVLAGGSNGQVQYNNSGAIGGFTVGGDGTLNTSTGALVVTKTNGTSFSAFATANPAIPPAIGAGTPNTGAFSLLSAGGVQIDPTSASTNDVMFFDGTKFLHNAITNVINSACLLSPSSCASLFGYYNIVWYGAVSGADTASRNSNALIAALTACAAGGEIFIPVGNYQYAVAQNQTVSNCSMRGANSGASILTYTGSANGWTLGYAALTLSNVRYSQFKFACSSTCANAVLVQNVSQSTVFDAMVFSAGSSGNHALQLTSISASIGGTFDVQIIGGTVIQNCLLECLYLNPLGSGLVNDINVSNVFVNGHQTIGISGNSGVSWNFSQLHVERHLGAAITSPAIHLDHVANASFNQLYCEDEANAACIELGGGVTQFSVRNANVGVNILGGVHTGANFISQNTSAPLPAGVTLENITVSANGTIGNVIDLGAATKVWGNNIALNVGTAAVGFSTASATANVHIGGLVTTGTFTTGPASNALPTSCASVTAGTVTVDGYGAVTHC